jgi:hypothetical protein
LKVFLVDKGINYLHEQISEPKIEMQIAYLADIFVHLNLNLQLRSSGNSKLEGSVYFRGEYPPGENVFPPEKRFDIIT